LGGYDATRAESAKEVPVNQADESLEVLLVDDDLTTLHLLEQFCRSRNLSVTTASDGCEAIAALEREPSRFTVVLTDINTPGADGFEVLKAARNGNGACYAVMITGYATLDSAVRAVREGAYDYLAKPFSLGQLDMMLSRIRNLLALEREIRGLRRRLAGLPAAAASAPLPVAPAAPTVDLVSRVDTMAGRLGKIDDMLRDAAAGPLASR
jgi:DNA-binding NtrC family response regulator